MVDMQIFPDNQLATDTISRQAAIDAVSEACFELRGIFKECEERLLALPFARPEQRWTPCSEGLPEEKDAGILKKLGINKRSDYVIATVEVAGERMTVATCTYDGVWYWDKKYAFPDFKVVAWMPLPEPYKGEQSG